MPKKISSDITPEPTPVETTVIEIISPIPGKGMDRKYVAYDWDTFNKHNVPDTERPLGFILPDESNSIDLGAIVRGSNGKAIKDATVTIVATDKTQNTTINATGMVKKMKDDEGNTSEIASIYPYHYEFKTKGKHTITFSVGNVEVSVELEVAEK